MVNEEDIINMPYIPYRVLFYDSLDRGIFLPSQDPGKQIISDMDVNLRREGINGTDYKFTRTTMFAYYLTLGKKGLETIELMKESMGRTLKDHRSQGYLKRRAQARLYWELSGFAERNWVGRQMVTTTGAEVGNSGIFLTILFYPYNIKAYKSGVFQDFVSADLRNAGIDFRNDGACVFGPAFLDMNVDLSDTRRIPEIARKIGLCVRELLPKFRSRWVHGYLPIGDVLLDLSDVTAPEQVKPTSLVRV